MSLRAISLLVIILVLVASSFAAILLGAESGVVIGLALGASLGLGLTLLGGVSMARAIRRGSKTAAVTHIYGGIAVRLGILVAGFLALAGTGWASPVAYALAFVGGVLAAMLRQVVVFVRDGKPAVAN